MAVKHPKVAADRVTVKEKKGTSVVEGKSVYSTYWPYFVSAISGLIIYEKGGALKPPLIYQEPIIS